MNDYHNIFSEKLNTNGVKFKAVIDLVEFQITTASPTQFRYVRAHLAEKLKEPPFVDPIDPATGKTKEGEGQTTNVFKIRMYDDCANSYRETLELFEHLAKRYPLTCAPQITGLELSFDAYSPDDKKLREVTRFFMAHLSAPNRDVRKFDPVRNETRRIDQWPDLDPTNPDGSLYVLSAAEPLAYRVYLKRTDGKRDGQQGTELLREQWRARAEFTLTGKKLEEHGLRSLGDLAKIDLVKLGKHLRFANPKSLSEVLEGKDAFQEASIRWAWDDRAVCLLSGWNRRDRGRDGYRKHAKPTLLSVSRYAEMSYPANRLVDREFAKLADSYLHDFDHF